MNYTMQTNWFLSRANKRYEQQLCLLGFNYIPAYAINQIEICRHETFDGMPA